MDFGVSKFNGQLPNLRFPIWCKVLPPDSDSSVVSTPLIRITQLKSTILKNKQNLNKNQTTKLNLRNNKEFQPSCNN